MSATNVSTPPTDDWQATRQLTGLATRVLTDEDDELAGGRGDVGRPTGPNELELFVSCAPEVALQQQFEHLQPPFIAVHDLGAHASRKLLVGLAAAGGRPVQRLAIRRQGWGTTLATLEFVELTTEGGAVVRLYTTASEADTGSRHALARVLLGFAQVGAIMVGDLPQHAIEPMLATFREAMLAGPWPNRDLLLLPLAAGTALAAHGAALGRGTAVSVRATPQVRRPADAWGYLNGTWARLAERAAPGDRAMPRLRAGSGGPAAAATTGDAPPTRIDRRTRPRPAVPTTPTAPMQPAARGASAEPVADLLIERYLRQVAHLPGVVDCCVFDTGRDTGRDTRRAPATSKPRARAGAGPAADALARHGTALLDAIVAGGTALGTGDGGLEAAITLGARHLLLRTIPRHPQLALHAIFDAARANPALARLQVQRLDAIFEPSASP